MGEQKGIKLAKNIAIQKKYGLDGGAQQSIFTSNIYDEEQTIAKLRSSFEILSTTIGKTLGPYGKTVLVEQHEEYPLITKDGKDVFDHIRFNDSVAHTVWTIVKRAIGAQARGVGDGTTSAIVVANKLYQNFIEALSDKDSSLSKLSPKDIIDINKYIVAELTEAIKKKATPVSKDFKEVAQIAAVSFNNDKEVGELIREIYLKTGTDGYISTYINPPNHLEHRVDYIKGFELEGASPINPEYLTFHDAENERVIYNDKPLVLMSSGTLTSDLIGTFLSKWLPNQIVAQQGSKPQDILFIAPDYDKGVKEFLMAFRKNTMTSFQRSQAVEIGSFIPIDYSTLNPENKLLFEDLSVAIGAKIYNPEKETYVDILKNTSLYLGHAERVEVGKYSTKIIVPENDYFKEIGKDYVVENKDFLLMQIRQGIEELEKSSTVAVEEDRGIVVMKKRLNRLTQYNSAIIDPAGSSLDERASSERLLEDAILSSRNAIRHGFISGGFLTASRVIKDPSFRNKVVSGVQEKFPWLRNVDIEDVHFTSSIVDDFLNELNDSYLEVFKQVLRNSDFLSDERIESTVTRCLEEDLFYNVKERSFVPTSDNTIINPVNLDLDILETISNIIMLLINTQVMVTRTTNKTEAGQQFL